MQVFISSTFVDLRDERTRLLSALQTPDRHPFGMELFLAEPSLPKAIIERKLRACDLYILILGFRAGSVLPDDPDHTYTTYEYDLAQELHKPSFVFIKTRNGLWANDETDSRLRDLLQTFRQRIPDNPAYFENVDQLETAVIRAITDWEARGIPGAQKTFLSFSEWLRSAPAAPGGLFDFEQKLYGRTAVTAELDAFAADHEKAVGVIVGRGGLGKSKLLREWIQTLNRSTLFLRDPATWSSETYKEIPVGKVLIVIDDAHRSDRLNEVLGLVKELRGARRSVQVLLSSRPSGKDRINEAISRRFEQSEVCQFTELKELRSEDAKQLARDLLGSSHQGNLDWLLHLADGNPLIIVIGSKLLRKDVPFGKSIQNSDQFRKAIFHKFLDELSVQDKITRTLLHLIAAVSPIPFPVDSFCSIAAGSIVQLPEHEISRELARLEEKGLLAVRSKALRIVPDVVSDFLLEEACIGVAGQPTRFPDAVFKAFKDTLLSNLLQNVGELDWRVHGRDVHEGLLVHIWGRVNESFKESDSVNRVQILKAVRPASVFQPEPVLDLVNTAIKDPGFPSVGASRFEFNQRDVLNALPPILRTIALNPDYTKKAARLLWQLSKDDERPQNQWPDHAARILSDMAQYEMYRPVHYNEQMLELVEEIVHEPDAFEHISSPLEILDNLLSREGDHTESAGLTITLSSFELAYPTIRDVRERALALLERLLIGNSPKAAVRSVRSLSTVLHSYLPKFGRQLSERELSWQDDERLEVLEIFKRHFPKLKTPVQAEVYSALRSLLAWRHGSTRVISAIEKYFRSIEPSNQLLLFDALATASWDLDRANEELSDTAKRRSQQLMKAAEILQVIYPTVKERVFQLEAIYETANSFGIELKGGTEFVDELCKNTEVLAALAEHLLSTHQCIPEFAFLMQVVVVRLRRLNPKAYKAAVMCSIDSKKIFVLRGAAAGLHTADLRQALDEDLEVLRELSKQTDERVRLNVLNALRFLVVDEKFRTAGIELAFNVDIDQSKRLADEFCEIFGLHSIGPTSLSKAQVGMALRKLLPIPDLDDYNITNFLNWVLKSEPELACDFFIDRVEFSAAQGGYRAIPFRTSGINLSGIPGEIDCSEQLRRIFSLLLKASDDNLVGQYELEELFWIFGGPNTPTISVLDEQVHGGKKEALVVVLDLLRHDAPQRLAFTHPWFALQVLEASSAIDPNLLNRAMQCLAINALPRGVRAVSPTATLAVDTSARVKTEQFKDIPLLRSLFTRIDEAFYGELRTNENMQRELIDFGQE